MTSVASGLMEAGYRGRAPNRQGITQTLERSHLSRSRYSEHGQFWHGSLKPGRRAIVLVLVVVVGLETADDEDEEEHDREGNASASR